MPAGSVEEAVDAAKQRDINGKLWNRAAIYEFAIVHPARPNNRIKVYLGKTTDLKRRHNEYLSSSEQVRMWPYFNHALQNGCQILRRYCYLTSAGKVKQDSEGDRAVTMMETRFLSYFDYAWNKEANPPKRSVYLKPRTVLCCFPGGVTVVSGPPFGKDTVEWERKLELEAIIIGYMWIYIYFLT